MIYLFISNEPKKVKSKRKMNLIERFLLFILPRSNPDFDDKIDLVSQWLLEFEDENSVPTREIGIGFDGKVLMKMPYNKNYGYWSDNNLTYNDFKSSFNVKIIKKDFFIEKWDLNF